MIMDPKIVRVLNQLKEYSPEKIILFGSQAKNSCDSYSDIDLIIKTEKLFLDRIKEFFKIIKPNFTIDILVYTPDESQKMLSEGNPFLDHVLKDGKVIYEKSCD
jgi:predicted nucleotidyltransferase